MSSRMFRKEGIPVSDWCPHKGEGIASPKWLGSRWTMRCMCKSLSWINILQCGSSTEMQVLKRDSMLMKTETKIEQVTSNSSEWLSVYLTREKTKDIYFPCHAHQKALTFFGSGGENAEHCCSSSSKPYMPIHFLEHEELFWLSFLEQSSEGHSESNVCLELLF